MAELSAAQKDTVQFFDGIALQWATLLTGRAMPAGTPGTSIAERTIGNKIDPLSLVLIVGFLGVGIYLVSKGR